jgi:KDO2-lipid IV(A) lauroyltransferase
MTVLHQVEAFALRAGIRMCRLVGPVAASNFGARVARAIGPWLPVSRTADSNLRLAMPDLDPAERDRIVRGAWENLGRTAAEMPHLAALLSNVGGAGWEVEGAEHLDALRTHGGPALFFSGHLANWELIGPAMAALGVPMAGIYRAASNPAADDIIQQLRRDARGRDEPMFPKGAQGARAAIAHLRAGRCLGMFVDQKMNDGIPVNFFGRPAMTAPALAHFALRFRCPVMPVHVERLGPAHLRLICEAPLALPESGDRATDAQAMTLSVNETLERWIRHAPESWLWLHRRWPTDKHDPRI